MVSATILSGYRRAEGPGVEVVNHGQIGYMRLPDGWSEDESVKQVNIGSRSVRQFRPRQSSDSKLYFYYRGFPVSSADGASFALTLSKDPHVVLSEEIQTLTAILGQRAKSDSFMILSLRTEDLNGRRVLILEGRYKELQQDIYEMFIDADGTGQAVQEIYLLAPKDQYVLYLRKVKAALQTLQWKESITNKN